MTALNAWGGSFLESNLKLAACQELRVLNKATDIKNDLKSKGHLLKGALSVFVFTAQCELRNS